MKVHVDTMNDDEDSDSDLDEDALEKIEQKYLKLEDQALNLLNGTKKEGKKIYRRSERWKRRRDEIDDLKKIFYQFL